MTIFQEGGPITALLERCEHKNPLVAQRHPIADLIALIIMIR
jgi:hypothetical protein